jgi:hypothetical protein
LHACSTAERSTFELTNLPLRLAYIESELAKRRGNTASEGYAPAEAYDPQAELFKLAEKYRWDNRKKDEEEGNVTNSLGMLTSIPEVDLGME